MRNTVLAFILCAFPLTAIAADLIQNGSFEIDPKLNSNDISGWMVRDEIGGNGTWVTYTGTAHPTPTFRDCTYDVEVPPLGSFAVMSTQEAQGSHVLFQDVMIPPGSNPVLSFQYSIRSSTSLLASPDDLSFQTSPNQQFRVDVIDPLDNEFTLNVLQNILVIGSRNPPRTPYETHSVRLTGFEGRLVRIRFAEVDNQGCMNVGIDDVRLETQPSGDLAPAIIRFTAAPQEIPFAGSTTLVWSTQNATSVEISGLGSVPTSGSRAISLRGSQDLTLTATGPSGTRTRTSNVKVLNAGPQIRFSATPSRRIERGEAATLTWTITGATAVSIDNGIGNVDPSSGSIVVTPSSTTEYTITATGSAATARNRATVFVNPGDVPIVSVTTFPRGIVAIAGAPAGLTDQFVLSNVGSVPTDVTIEKDKDFFTLSPTSFSLDAGKSQTVTITTTTQMTGKSEGAALPSGTGVPVGLRIPVNLFIAAAPQGTIIVNVATARTEIAAPAGENPTGSVSFTNSGTGTLQGIATSDVAWLIPQSGVITIGPGETKAVTFTTNRALRPDADSQAGGAVGTLTLTYVVFGSSSAGYQASGGGSSKQSISVTIVDVVKPGARPGAPPPLSPGELALFVPGLFQSASSSSDLSVSVSGNSISDLNLYFGAPGLQVQGSLDQIAPNAGLILTSALQSVAGIAAQTGTVQARSMELARISLAGSQTASSKSASYITALPTFRSDRGVDQGGVIYLPGVEKRAPMRSTTLFVQEVAGFDATATIDFLDASGSVVSTRSSQPIDAFSLLSLRDSAPEGAASARVTNTSSTMARIVAYARVIDAVTEDEFVVVDSQSSEQIVGVPGTINNSLYVLNPGDTPLEIAIENQISTARRRAVRTSTDAATNMTIAPLQTMTLPINFSTGYVRVTAARPFALSARSVRIGAFNSAFGSALPVFATSTALAAGNTRRFGSIEDASRATVSASTPITYRSSLGLIESSGQPATVRLTLRYSFSAGTKTTAQGVSNPVVTVMPNRLMMIDELARAIIGPSRDNYGDLRNMQLDVEVIGGSGRVLPFVQTIDNGSTDSAIRTE